MSWRQAADGRGGANDDARGGNGRWQRGRSPPRQRAAGPGVGNRDRDWEQHRQSHYYQSPPNLRSAGRGGRQQHSSRKGASTWDLKAQRRERAIWSEGVRALEALQATEAEAEGADVGAVAQCQPNAEAGREQLQAAVVGMKKVLDELSTVRPIFGRATEKNDQSVSFPPFVHHLLPQLALPVASISVEEVGTLLGLVVGAVSHMLIRLNALLKPAEGGAEQQEGEDDGAEGRLLAYSLAMLGQRACQFISATLLKMGSDRGALPLTLRQLGT